VKTPVPFKKTYKVEPSSIASTDNWDVKDANNGRSLSELDLRINHAKHMRFGFWVSRLVSCDCSMHHLKSLLWTEKPVPAGHHLTLVFQLCLSPKNLQEARYSLGRCSSFYVALRLARVLEKKKTQLDEQLDMGVAHAYAWTQDRKFHNRFNYTETISIPRFK
jgi:hypothetical protein